MTEIFAHGVRHMTKDDRHNPLVEVAVIAWAVLLTLLPVALIVLLVKLMLA